MRTAGCLLTRTMSTSLRHRDFDGAVYWSCPRKWNAVLPDLDIAKGTAREFENPADKREAERRPFRCCGVSLEEEVEV